MQLSFPSILAILAVATAIGCLNPIRAAQFISALAPCPAVCEDVSTSWTVYTSLNRLQICDKPLLLDFTVHNPLDKPDTTKKIFACTVPDKANGQNVLNNTIASPAPKSPQNQSRAYDRQACGTGRKITQVLGINVNNEAGTATTSDLDVALTSAQGHLSVASCDLSFAFSYVNGAVVGIFSGAALDNAASAQLILDRVREHIPQNSAPKQILAQLCGHDRNADHTFGVAIDTTGDLAAVQQAARQWSMAKCVKLNGAGFANQLAQVTVVEEALGPTAHLQKSEVQKRDNCKVEHVVSGDSCGSLATKCGISGSQFTKYNPNPSLCSTLTVGERVCCSPGSLPDITPKENADGSCASYTVQTGDTCSAIAASHGLNSTALNIFNDQTTWGWRGCNDLQLGLRICLSVGSPPMPASLQNAVCGPTVPGTKPPSNHSILAALNPCPLNACCDQWGQCGITPEFCTVDEGPTGNPGTAPKGQNGCISNCGTNITNNDHAPSEPISVGYYESWNFDRPCLNMLSSSIGLTGYTHMHWAFGSILPSFNVQLNDTYNQWPGFMAMYQIKKIVSFGGWGFSTSPATYDILRRAMEPENVDTFVDNIAKFVAENGIDGVDFDWEYPGARDIPGIPPGLKSDGPNYLAFIKALRDKLSSDISISIAAPASYWYLQNFPIHDMANYVDYIVFMTYDLHGQWDYGNAWSDSGCPAGNCLRSHVNATETHYALAMLTKAGVEANKIAVGVSSYGRSFEMTRPGCHGPMCTYTGPKSGAKPGLCTQTPGILANAEIYNIIGLDSNITAEYYDEESDSNVLVYDETQWVAYMDNNIRSRRKNYYESLNFAGSVDWAVDLAEMTDDPHNPSAIQNLAPAPPLAECSSSFDSLAALGDAGGSIPQHCITQYTTSVLLKTLQAAMTNYTDMMNNDYDSKFQTYAQAVASSAMDSVHKWVYNNGNKYFTCVVTENSICCDQCKRERNACKYCFDGPCTKSCDNRLTCGQPGPVQVVRFVNASEPCPPDYSQRGPGPDNPYEQTVYWTLEENKEKQFFADLLTNTGIPKNKIEFGPYDRGNDCPPSASLYDGNWCWGINMDFGFPKPTGYSASDVTNPKNVVVKAQKRSAHLGPQLESLLFDMSVDAWMGNGFELIDAISLPVLMIDDAVQNMAKVVHIADKIDAQKREEIIMAFLSAILFFIPIAGEFVGAVGEMADIANILRLAGAAGNTGMDVYTIVKHPKNSPLAIMGLILTPGSLGDAANIARAARIRRAIPESDVGKLGTRVTDGLTSIKKLTGKCYAK